MAPALGTAVLVLLNAVGSVAVVDLPRLGVGEGFVRFGDFAELVGGFGGAVFVGVEFLGEGAVGAFDVAWGGGFIDAEGLGGRLELLRRGRDWGGLRTL